MSYKKITESTIAAIKEMVANDKITMNECAIKLNIPFSTFKRICVHLGIYSPRPHLQREKIKHVNNTNLKNKSRQIVEDIIAGKKTNITSYKLKNRLFEHDILKNTCSECGLYGEWNHKPIQLELDHIDGNTNNNTLANLRILCPNCHSQTATYCRPKTRKNKRVNYNELSNIILEYKPKTICELTKLLGITKASGNYKTIKRELAKQNIQLIDQDESYKTYEPVTCIECGVTLYSKRKSKSGKCLQCAHLVQYKCKHPSKKELIDQLKVSNPYALSRVYGVSDNAIRKWMDKYDIPRKKEKLREYLLNI